MDSNLKKRISGNIKIDEVELLTSGYKNWRSNKKDNKDAFFMVFKDIEDYLPDIPNAALKLYIYYGFAAKNETGESWHSIATIATALGVTNKTVETHNAKLEELGMIKRIQTKKRSKSTYLLPLSDFVQNLGNIATLTNWVTSPTFKSIYGETFNYYHFVEGRDKKTVRHYYVVRVSKDFGSKNKRNIYYYICDKTEKSRPRYTELSELDDYIYSLPTDDFILKIEEKFPESYFIPNGIDLSKDKEVLELLNLFETHKAETTYNDLPWAEEEV